MCDWTLQGLLYSVVSCSLSYQFVSKVSWLCISHYFTCLAHDHIPLCISKPHLRKENSLESSTTCFLPGIQKAQVWYFHSLKTQFYKNTKLAFWWLLLYPLRFPTIIHLMVRINRKFLILLEQSDPEATFLPSALTNSCISYRQVYSFILYNSGTYKFISFEEFSEKDREKRFLLWRFFVSALPSSFVTPKQPINSWTDKDLSLFTSQYSTNFFTHFLGFDFFLRNLLNGLISFLPISPLEFLSSCLKYQWTTLSSRVWFGLGSETLKQERKII